MTTEIDSGSTAELSRFELSMRRIFAAWRRTDDPRARAFERATYDFFTLYVTNPNTRRGYLFAFEEFYDWLDITCHELPLPDRVERSKALRYADWLRTRPHGLDEARLLRDPDRRLEAAVYGVVRRSPGLRIEEIRTSLDPSMIDDRDPLSFDKFLACMVSHHMLSRSPSVEELRRQHKELMRDLDGRIDPNLFAYSIASHTEAKGYARSSSIAQRLTVLSSLWSYYIDHTGENVGGESKLIGVNIWKDPLEQYQSQATSYKKVSRAQKTPTVELLNQILAPINTSSFDDVRDRAIFVVEHYTGLRASEMGSLRRVDLQGGVLTVVGKGSKVRQFAVPPEAMAALGDLDLKIRELAEDGRRRHPDGSSRMERLLEDSAPLFPAKGRWGCNAHSRQAAEESGLTRAGIAMMIRRRAIAAGVEPGTLALAKLHPHGLRRLAAQTSASEGTPLNVIQGVLGHASVATTGGYTEEHDPRKLSLGVQTQAPAKLAPIAIVRPQIEVRAPKPETFDEDGVIVLAAKVATARAEPDVPRELRLVAVGGQAPLPKPLPSQIELDARTSETFDVVYAASRWGEHASRERLHARKKETASVDHDKAEDALVNTYVGLKSGLLWWTGPVEGLKPEMPILAPSQILEDRSFRSGMDDLWMRWVANEETDSKGKRVERGPTAARALLLWLRQGLEVAGQAEAELKTRHGRWFRYDAPAADTLTKRGEPPRAFRAHRDDKVMTWFEVRGYTYMDALGGHTSHGEVRQGRVIDSAKGPTDRFEKADAYRPPADEDLFLESWFDEADPVASLPSDQKAELFDWLRMITGRPPTDKTPKYRRKPTDKPTISSADLAKLVGQMCAYHAAIDARYEMANMGGDVGRAAIDEMRAERERVLDEEEIDESAEVEVGDTDEAAEAQNRVEEIAEVINATVASLKGGKFDIAQRVSDWRKFKKVTKQTKQLEGNAASGLRRDAFYMQVLADLFGEEVRTDQTLMFYARCGRGGTLPGSLPLGGEYADLFRLEGGTIVHTPDFQKEFARMTGAHSECVARRLARQMWEMHKLGLRDATNRIDRLAPKLAAWAYYKVPCPAPLEAELRDRLGGAPPNLATAWAMFEGSEKGSAKEEMTQLAALQAGAARAAESPSVMAAEDIFGGGEGEEKKGGFTIERRGAREPVAKSYVVGDRVTAKIEATSKTEVTVSVDSKQRAFFDAAAFKEAYGRAPMGESVEGVVEEIDARGRLKLAPVEDAVPNGRAYIRNAARRLPGPATLMVWVFART